MLSLLCLVNIMHQCPHCKKTNTLRAGLRKNQSGFIQRYFCSDCNKYFIDRKGFENMRTSSEIIVTALDLRAQGLSYGKICKHIKEVHHKKISRKTILDWQNKFGDSIKKFTKSFQLSHSQNAHADEIFLREKGQQAKDIDAIVQQAFAYAKKTR